MAKKLQSPHIHNIERFANSHPYKSKGGGPFKAAQRNRNQHGNRILKQLQKIQEQFDLDPSIELPDNIVRDDAIYVEFISEWDHELKFDQLQSESNDPKYQILSIKVEPNTDQTKTRYRANVMLTKGGINHFIKRVNEYITENTKNRKGEDSGKPKANDLIANINSIQSATLKSFWMDGPEIPFPEVEEVVWWEVWFRRTNNEAERNHIIQNLQIVGAQIGMNEIVFPEHTIRLVRATANQLSKSLLILDSLAELRKPQEICDFLLKPETTLTEKESWRDDLISRLDNGIHENSVMICLLDSGVNNQHPLISPFLPNGRMYSYKTSWGNHDDYPQGGHGTGTAGLALYGDMADSISSTSQIQILHGLESYKIFNYNSPNEPELYGAIYELACSTPIVDYPNNPRIYCLSVTNKEGTYKGRPSSSSAAIDKIAFGSIIEPKSPQLVLISGGNVIISSPSEYDTKNFEVSVHDPAQSYNAISVGSYTRKDRIDPEVFPGWSPLAPYGGIAPSNSTSWLWERRWPNKPDIVMEGGNLGHWEEQISDIDTLQLITTDKDHRTRIFQPFGDTSAAVALASRLAAQLASNYPDYWPETIRGLLIHSAEWTEAMLSGINMNYEAQRIRLLRTVGYGVPVFEKARYSGENSLTLIAQAVIQPYALSEGSVKYNEYHLYELPWPKEVLREMDIQDVTLKVTLSYFIEPNPGERQYSSHFRYHSHELDFKLIKFGEDEGEFMARISKAAQSAEDTEEEEVSNPSEKWYLGRVRSKGSVKRDQIQVSGFELSRRNILAVYPKNGWYRLRKKLGKVNDRVRYSLIVSIETEAQEVDLYTPVFNEVSIEVPV